MTVYTVREKMNCAMRELRMRESVYPRWVEKGRMTPQKADLEIKLMTAIVEDYRALYVGERLI